MGTIIVCRKRTEKGLAAKRKHASDEMMPHFYESIFSTWNPFQEQITREERKESINEYEGM
jgi:hypothetical protein